MDDNFISGNQIAKALLETYRVYLCGNLSNPQPELEWINDENIEIGISKYTVFTADKPHFHEISTEYNYIVEGTSKVFYYESENEYTLEQGSLFTIPPKTKYATKHLAGTKILFIKTPGGNDKQLAELTSYVRKWLKAWSS